MEEHSYFKNGFLKTLLLIREYLPEIVIGGGWVPLIYYHYLLGKKSVFPLLTRDIDIMVNETIPVKKSKTLDEILTDAGLKTIFLNTGSVHPVTHYEGTIENYEVEIEFITNLKGRGDKGVIEVQKGLYAEALRYISVCIQNTQEIKIDDFIVSGSSEELTVRIPTPEAFLFHKGLTFPQRRESPKKGKDLYYMFDILANCPELEAQIETGLEKLKSGYSVWFNKFILNLKIYFTDDISDGIKLIELQKPENSFIEMDDWQFRQYVFRIFTSFIEKVENI